MAVRSAPTSLRRLLNLDTLEARAVPAAGMATVRELASASAAEISVVRDQFRSDLDLRREVNWDGVPDSLADPNTMPGDLFAGRGLLLNTNGTAFKVSGDPAVVGDPASNFGSIDPTYRTAFQPFSNPRLFTSIGGTVTDVTFVIPGTNTPGTVRGFGAIFSDVDTAAGAKLEFFDKDGNLIFSRAVPALAGNGNYSFLGASFENPIIATVRITSGTAPLGTGVDDVTQGGNADLVVMDDFIYAEPGPVFSPVSTLPKQIATGIDAGGSPLAKRFDANGQELQQYTAFTPEFTGGVRVAQGDVNLDGVDDLIFGTGPGMATQVRIVDGATGATLGNFMPFEVSFTGGVYVAAGDFTGDGRVDIVVTPDQGGGPRVKIYSGSDFSVIADFFGIDDPSFRGGARPAVGDINGDGKPDLVIAAGFGGGPRVAIFDGTTLFGGDPVKLIPDFFAFEPSLRDGLYPAVGDVNGDGFGDLIFGGGPQGGPRVLILSGDALLTAGSYEPVPPTPEDAVLASFFAGDPNSRGGIRVAAANLDGDNFADVVTGAGPGSGTTVRTYFGSTIQPGIAPPINTSFTAFSGFAGGVFVG